MSMTLAELTEREFALKPILFVELARQWVTGGLAPDRRHEEWLKDMTRPFLHSPAEGREALWGLLATTERGRGLMWLDRVGLLHELLPCWSGDRERRNKRLQSVEELHLERWAEGLGDASLSAIDQFMDERVDGRLNRWALTGLSCLLLSGDLPSAEHAREVERDLTALEATPDEISAVVNACLDYPRTYEFLARSGSSGEVNLMAVVACLASLFAYPNLDEETRREAVRRANLWIERS